MASEKDSSLERIPWKSFRNSWRRFPEEAAWTAFIWLTLILRGLWNEPVKPLPLMLGNSLESVAHIFRKSFPLF